jgi:ELWxxDGT repeat protein
MGRPLVSRAWLRFVAAGAAAALVVLAVTAPVGAAGAPSLVEDINSTGSSNPTGLTQVGNTLFFAADDGVHGVELWKTDGTAAGTKMVKDIRPLGKSSSPENLTAVGNTLFFTAVDGKHGRELWKSNGTKAGTVMVKDLIPPCRAGSEGCFGGLTIDVETPPVAVGSRLFFFNGVCRGCPYGAGSDLYVSDGTAAGTKQLAADELFLPVVSSTNGTAFNGRFYFVADGETAGGMWVSDGTQAGTHVLVTRSAVGEEISILPASGRSLYFTAFHSGELSRLWKTDGTAGGTKPLTTLGDLNWEPTQAAYMAKRLYFDSGYRDTAKSEAVAELWKTDGTALGTKPILTAEGGALDQLTAAGGRLFFTITSALWKSDGTPAGTKDIGEFGKFWPSQLIAVGGKLCFAERYLSGEPWELWESDGTAAGTHQVRSFVRAPGEVQQAVVGSKLFFAADDGVHGVELWSYTP